jgi:lipoprotein-anchoring transpeptidase ErfK/SrfK
MGEAEPAPGFDPYHRAGARPVVERIEGVDTTGNGKGRHRRRVRWGWLSIAGIVAGVVVVLLAGAAFAGYSYDRAKAETVLPGVRVQGVDVGGMSRAEAAKALAPATQRFLQRPIEITAGKKSWSETPEELGVQVDVDEAVTRALNVSDSLAWPSRVYHRLFGRPVAASVDLPFSVDPTVVTQFAQRISKEVFLGTQDAKIDFADGKLVLQHAQVGQKVNQQKAAGALLDALHAGSSTVAIDVKKTRPKVTDKNIGQVIVIRLSQEKLYLYDKLKLKKTYSVATGQPIYPTPQGHFEIITKEVNPTWINPARDTWGKDEPPKIGPGPGNPLGTRAMALSAPGILIHGTPDDSSIGTAASHGCIRMHMWDVEQLFTMVSVGTPVIIAE